MRRVWGIIGLATFLLLAGCGTQAEPETEVATEAITEEVTEPVTEAETEAETEQAAETKRMFSERYPLAVMIDNHPDALPQAGLQNADIIYEMQVEGRLTRLMIVTDEAEGEIGPIRSARPAFLNFVVEHGGYYLHVGNFEYVESSPVGPLVKDMDQFAHADNAYYRVNRKVAPHNMYADIEEMYKAIEREGYESEPSEALGYLRSSITDLPQGEPGKTIKLTYDNHLYQRYEYDGDKNGYVKFINDEPVIDEGTVEPLVITSYIILRLNHELMANNTHWAIDDVGEGNALLYHGGQQIPITWKREDNGKPMLFLLEEEELVFPDGLLYIQIIPDWLEVE